MKAEGRARRGAVFYLSACALAGIWGYVFFRVAAGLDEPPAAVAATTAVRPEPAAVSVRRVQQATYAADFRDPFAWPPELSADEPAEAVAALEAAPVPPAGPAVSLAGVVGATAMLRARAGEVLFARAGETAAGVRVVAVHPDLVVTTFEGRTDTLRLTQ